ncbi:hypothetical protein [Nostoc sp. C117]|uniref:hypothetical protein n=1 Tax=Nostoc sp. C117 TaxID=3349875 RepID=UPI00370D5F88
MSTTESLGCRSLPDLSAIALLCLTQRCTRYFTLLSDRYNRLTTKFPTYLISRESKNISRS